MDSEIDKVLELEKENNKMLRKLVSDLRWRRFWGIFKWSLIVAVTLGTYYYVQPYLDMLLNIYTGGALNAVGGTDKLIDISRIQDLVKGLQN